MPGVRFQRLQAGASRRWMAMMGPLLTLAAIGSIELFARSWITSPSPRPLPAYLGLTVVISALLGGVRAGLVSAALAWTYLFLVLSPESNRNPHLLVLLISYPAIVGLIVAMRAWLMRSSRMEAERDAARTQTIELEALVAERTRALVASEEAQRNQTERLRVLYEELAEAYRHQQELGRLKDDFLSTISHEFRTPLTAIKAAAWILEQRLEGELNPSQESVVSIVITHADHLHRMINDLLDLSKMEAGQLSYHPTEGDLARLAREVAISLSQLFSETGIELALEVGTEPLPATFDHDRMRQVLLNLLSNASKFTNAGGKVTLRVSPEDAGVRIEVEDTGIGIAPEHHAKVFTKFFQIDSTATRSAGGTGLGLAICRSIVEEGHAGQIWVESALHEGSTFVVRLPQALPAKPPTASPADSSQLP